MDAKFYEEAELLIKLLKTGTTSDKLIEKLRNCNIYPLSNETELIYVYTLYEEVLSINGFNEITIRNLFIPLKPIRELTYNRILGLTEDPKILDVSAKLNNKKIENIKIISPRKLSDYMYSFSIKMDFENKLNELEIYERELKILLYNKLLKDKRGFLDLVRRFLDYPYLLIALGNHKLRPFLTSDQRIRIHGYSITEALGVEADKVNDKLIPIDYKIMERLKIENNSVKFLVNYPKVNKIYMILYKLDI